MQRAFADRAEYLGDSDFVKVPLAGLTSKEYAAKLRAEIGAKATPSSVVRAGVPPGAEPDHTTHLTVMDSAGMAVSTTQTVNGWFGSGFVVEGTGVLLNNEMDDFSIKPGVPNLFGAIGNEKNAIQAGKRPLSSMSPAIVFREGKPVLALGSPSGTRIITCVASVIVNRLAFGLPLYDSVALVRYHHQWQPDELRVDAPGFPRALETDLKRRGHKLNVSNLGCRVAAVELRDGLLHGVADPRGEGLSLGE
jgi:gamma-glutamyltranspeptidase/glutathione hydrolase